VTESSEADGFFQSDNLVSNELTLQQIIPELVKQRAPGGVYLGVGPDQNFTHRGDAAARRSSLLPRGAMLQHLMHKALFELAEDAEFLSLLFSRPRPAGVRPSRANPATGGLSRCDRQHAVLAHAEGDRRSPHEAACIRSFEG
jgi:hypothetical protein